MTPPFLSEANGSMLSELCKAIALKVNYTTTEGVKEIMDDLAPDALPPALATLAAPAICFLPQDAFYFGIASVMAGVMGQFGVSPDQAAVASMVGQSFRLNSPVIPALYMLCERTEINFVDFQKEYTKYAWPILFIYLAVHTLTGVMPFK